MRKIDDVRFSNVGADKKLNEKRKDDRMLRALTGIMMGASLLASPVLAQSTTSTVLTGEAFGFQVMDSTTPDSFSFTAQTNVEPDAIDVISNIITVSGITESVTVSVSDLGSGGTPQISVNGSLYTSSPVQVSEGDSLRVSIVPVEDVFEETYQAEVTIGGGSAIFSVTTRSADTTPDAYSFLVALNQEPATVVASFDATITGLEAPATVSVSGAGLPELSLDGGSSWVSSGQVANNGTLAVRLTSGSFGVTRVATVTIGGVSETFSVTTRSSNENPVFADFTDETSAEPNVTVVSDPVTVSGVETSVTASVSGDGLPELQVNDGAWVAVGSNGTVVNGDTVKVRLTSGNFNETKTATLDVNGVTQNFSVTTRAADVEPEPFLIAAMSDVGPNALTQSSTTITGVEAASSVTISGEGNPAFSTDGGTTWVDDSGSGSVENAGTILVRLTSGSFDTTRTATLTVGGVTGSYSVTTQGQDTTPDAFTFASTLAVGGTVSTSDPATLSGFTGALAISVSGDGSPEYRIGAGSWTNVAGSVSSGQDVQVRLTSSASEGVTSSAVIFVGDGSATFTVETQDRTPTTFTLAAVTGSDLNVMTASDPVTINGITGSVPISVEDVFNAEYRINGGSWTGLAGSLSAGDEVEVRLLTANTYSAERTANLIVGTTAETLSVTTRPQDTTPDTFTFTSQLVASGTVDVSSESVILSGFDATVPVSLSGDASAEYRIGTDSGSVVWGEWLTAAGSVSAGQLIEVRLDASGSEGLTRSVTVQVGSGSSVYEVESQDQTPDAFAFNAVTSAGINSTITSDAVQISGVNGAVSASIPEGNGALFRIGSGPDAGNITWAPEGFLDHTEVAATVSDGDWVMLSLTASGSYETEVTTSLTIGNGSALFSVTTGSEPASITITSGSVPDAEKNQAYAGFDFTTVASVSGGSTSSPPTVNDLAWSVTGGVLPAGMSLSAAGDLTGTPTEIGSFNFTVQAELGGQTASASYSIIVNDPDGSFVIEGG